MLHPVHNTKNSLCLPPLGPAHLHLSSFSTSYGSSASTSISASSTSCGDDHLDVLNGHSKLVWKTLWIFHPLGSSNS